MIIKPDQPLIKLTTALMLDESIEKAHKLETKRGHLGMSGVADEDMRTTWLKFRWSLPEEFTARTLRIFSMGHMVEDLIVKDLLKIPGLKVYSADPNTGAQFNFSFLGGHFRGSMDGCAIGVVEAPMQWHVMEYKSAKDETFQELKKLDSYQKWNPIYYGQIQCYMGASGMKVALVVVYNKDTSELHFERIKTEPMFWESMQVKAQDLLEVQGPPHPPQHYHRDYFKIKNWKSDKYQRVYWGDELPAPNCRNCKHAQIAYDGHARWYCQRWQKDLTIEEQAKGCDLHLYLPPLMPADKIEDHGTVVRYKTREDKPIEFWNSEDLSGAKGQQIYSSKQLHSLSETNGLTSKILADSFIHQLIDKVDGAIA